MTERTRADIASSGLRVRRRRAPSRFSQEKIARLVVAALVVGSVLALGAQQAMVALAFGVPAAVLAVIAARALAQPPLLLWVILALVGFTLLQLVPLPLSVLKVVAPHAAGVWAEALKPLGEPPPSFASISLDPQATALEAVKWATYCSVLVGALVVRSERGAVWIVQLLFASALVVALVTLLHGLLGAERIYGFYQPSFAVERFRRGPLLNSNNLSSYMNLGLGAAAGLWLSRRATLPAWLLGSGAFIMLCVGLASGSRAGLLSLCLAAVGLAVWFGRRGAGSRRARHAALVGAGSVALALGVALVLAGDRLLGEWASRDVCRKLAGWRWSLDLIADNAVFGVGRGAFEAAFSAYRGHLSRDWTSVFSHPENLVLQWVTEWGLLAGAAALVGCASIVGRAFWRGRRDGLRMGLAFGLGAMIVQNLADLGSELPGVAIAATVAVAALLDRHELRRDARGGLATAGALFSGVLILAIGFAHGREQVRPERERFAERYRALDVKDAHARTAFRAELADAMRRHPAEPYFPLVGALVAHRGQEANVLRWLDRALELGPTYGTTHLLLATALRGRGAVGQALLHLRLASEYDGTLAGVAARRAAAWARSTEQIESAVPPTDVHAELLAEACRYVTDAPLAAECWRRAVVRKPGDVPRREQLVQVLARAFERNGPPCSGSARPACVTEVRAEVQHLERTGKSWRAIAALAAIAEDLVEQKHLAHKVLSACPPGLEGTDCARRSLELADRFAELDLAMHAAERLVVSSCTAGAECAEAHEAVANVFTRHQAWGLALRHRLEAARVATTAARWMAVAECAARARNFSTAYVALERAQNAPELTQERREQLRTLRGELQTAAARIEP